jgi:2-octaprenyl-3-methyl-6-methoxy-1,4-benzoquinol hydroxylase
MSRRGSYDVAVIGAGVVGSTAALSMAGEGLRVAIVEAHEPPPWRADDPDLRVYAFAADSQALLDSLGVWPTVASARVQPYRRMRVWDAGAAGEMSFDADAFARDCLGHIVEHALLVDRLWAAVSRHPGIERFCPDKLVELDQDESSAGIALQSGRRLHARLVLGADGAASRVRELAGFPLDELDYGQCGLVAYVRTARPHEDTCWQRFLPSGPLAFLPCSDGRSSIVWTLPTSEAERLLGVDEARFGAELTRAFDARLGEVTGVSERRAFPLRRKLATQMLRGRLALIGDAAHAVHPLAGQGVNLGLRDVGALSACVHEARSSGLDFSSPHRLQRWARARLSENAVATYSFEAINRIFSNDALLPTLVRGPLLGLAGRFPPLAQFFWRRAAGL